MNVFFIISLELFIGLILNATYQLIKKTKIIWKRKVNIHGCLIISGIYCIEPETPSNGFLRMDHNYVNGTVIYECESGYDIIGYPEWRCQSNGKWDHDCVKCASEGNS
jgi:hypothetical protein